MVQRIDLICVGKAKPGSGEQQIFTKYVKRCRWQVRLVELPESREIHLGRALGAEAKAITAKLAPTAALICLDERGQDLTSPALAEHLAATLAAAQVPTFLIGGSQGLAPELRARAGLCLRLGRLVWPHLLARAMLAEQLYRAQSILDGHPYHRA